MCVTALLKKFLTQPPQCVTISLNSKQKFGIPHFSKIIGILYVKNPLQLLEFVNYMWCVGFITNSLSRKTLKLKVLENYTW